MSKIENEIILIEKHPWKNPGIIEISLVTLYENDISYYPISNEKTIKFPISSIPNLIKLLQQSLEDTGDFMGQTDVKGECF